MSSLGTTHVTTRANEKGAWIVNGGEEKGVLVVEPHEPYRHALAELIEESSYSLVASAAHADEALDAIESKGPALIVLCFRGRADASLAAKLAFAAPEAAIIAISSREDGETVVEALRAGARAFVPKRAAPAEILEAISRTWEGGMFVHPAIAVSGLSWAVEHIGRSRNVEHPLSRLTPREREIVGYLAEGLTSSGIAVRLFISRRTVEGHLASAYRKLGVRSRIEAVQCVLTASADV